MARNCPGGQQVFTSVLKASVEPERTPRATNIDIKGHIVTGVAGVEQSQSGYEIGTTTAIDATSVMCQHKLANTVFTVGKENLELMQTVARRSAYIIKCCYGSCHRLFQDAEFKLSRIFTSQIFQ